MPDEPRYGGHTLDEIEAMSLPGLRKTVLAMLARIRELEAKVKALKGDGRDHAGE